MRRRARRFAAVLALAALACFTGQARAERAGQGGPRARRVIVLDDFCGFPAQISRSDLVVILEPSDALSGQPIPDLTKSAPAAVSAYREAMAAYTRAVEAREAVIALGEEAARQRRLVHQEHSRAAAPPPAPSKVDSVPGAISTQIVRRVVLSAQDLFRGCYSRWLRRQPELAGEALLSFTIGEGGRVTSAVALGSTLPESIGQCLADQMRELRFPPPEGGAVRVSQLFLFRPARRASR